MIEFLYFWKKSISLIHLTKHQIRGLAQATTSPRPITSALFPKAAIEVPQNNQ